MLEIAGGIILAMVMLGVFGLVIGGIIDGIDHLRGVKKW